MKIAVDCRYLGKSGIGRVCQGILENLDFDKNTYYLIGKSKDLKDYKKAVIIENDTDPFSLSGLIKFPKEINKECDALFLPNFIIPFGVKIPVLSIMHDLIFLDLKKMNKGLKDKIIKRFLLKRCVKKSKSIACVSGFTLNRCAYYYPKYKDKFFVNYNGLSDNVLNYESTEQAIKTKTNLLYVGNVKPHKGLYTLIKAFKLLGKDYSLKIVGEKDNFITGVDGESLLCDGVEFTGRLNDDELLKEFCRAGLLVQPSEYEGFGLTPLEALYLGTKPIVSDIEVFKEVYDGFDVDFFNVGDENALKQAIIDADILVKDQKEKINQKYSYKNAAKKIEEKLEDLVR